ncbi:MAG: type II secretion system protein M [Candidatus Omnitrophica bacterium]|nr:type II secretion system protein M [Candidatus Omnitrophota bacterium]
MIDPRLSQSLAVLAAACMVMVSWWWGYQPAVRAVRQDRQQAEVLRAQLAQVEAMVQTSGGIEVWHAHHLKRLDTLKHRFPPQAHLPQLLNTLVDTVKMGEVKLVNVSQGNVEPVTDAEQPLLVDGQPCYRLPVTLTAEGRYHAIVQALERLMAETFPSVVGLQYAELQLKDPQGVQLAATLQLYLYVVGGAASEPAPDAP